MTDTQRHCSAIPEGWELLPPEAIIQNGDYYYDSDYSRWDQFYDSIGKVLKDWHYYKDGSCIRAVRRRARTEPTGKVLVWD